MPADPLLTGLANFVESTGQGYTRSRNLVDQRRREDELLGRARKERLEDVGRQRSQKLEDEALNSWLGMAKEAGFLTAKTKEERDRIASLVDQSFLKLPVYGKLLPMVKQRMEMEAQANQNRLPDPQIQLGKSFGLDRLGSIFQSDQETQNMLANQRYLTPYSKKKVGTKFGLPGYSPATQPVDFGGLDGLMRQVSDLNPLKSPIEEGEEMNVGPFRRIGR